MTDQEIIQWLTKAAQVFGAHSIGGNVLLAAAERIRVLGEAIDRIANLTDCPNLGERDMQKGLHCGLEDRDIINRYEAADYGFEDASERWSEWAKDEAGAARAATDAARRGA